MPVAKITKRVVEELGASSGDVVFWDEALPGFGVRAKASGVRSYLIQYRDRVSGKSRE